MKTILLLLASTVSLHAGYPRLVLDTKGDSFPRRQLSTNPEKLPDSVFVPLYGQMLLLWAKSHPLTYIFFSREQKLAIEEFEKMGLDYETCP